MTATLIFQIVSAVIAFAVFFGVMWRFRPDLRVHALGTPFGVGVVIVAFGPLLLIGIMGAPVIQQMTVTVPSIVAVCLVCAVAFIWLCLVPIKAEKLLEWLLKRLVDSGHIPRDAHALDQYVKA